MATAAVGACCAAPQPAFATYADVTDTYPASQDVTPAGDEIPASRIPEGTYSITAETSSYMCRITNCTLAVKDGKMAATFTMSKAYTRLYLGTAEEAAAHTNADGTDDSAYYRGTPADGYVYHVYTIPVSLLNHKMELATYAGGTKTCKWFSRTVCFNASAEVNEAIATGKAPEPKGGAGDGSGGKAGSGEGPGGGVAATGSGTSEKGSTVSGPSGKPASESKDSKAGSGSGSKATTGRAAATGSGGGTGSGGSAAGTSSEASGNGASGGTAGGPSASSAAAGKKAARKAAAKDAGPAGDAGGSAAKPKAAPRVIALTPAQAATLAGGELPDADVATDDEADDATAYHVALGVVVAAIAALAVVLGISLRRIRKLRTNFGRKG